MATGKTIDQLVIEIKADTRQLKKDLNNIKGQLRTTGAAGGAAFGSMAASLSKVKVGALAAVAGLVALGAAAKKVGQVGAGFEDLKDSLDQVFGSIESGDKAMNQIFQFAQTTPFQIETATQAFIALKSAGIEPSMDMLQTFADTASVSVDQLGTFNALIRVIQRSAGGGLGLEELNMIADRGIDVFGGLKDELGLSRDEIAEFGKTAEGAKQITDALIVSLNKKFGGAMESKMDNLSTKTSNMVIAFRQLGDELFKSGLGDFLKDMADRLTDLANAIAENIRLTRGEATFDDLNLTHLDPEDQQMALDELIRRSEEKIKAFDERMAKRAAERGIGGTNITGGDLLAGAMGSFVGTGEGFLDGLDIENERKLLASYKKLLLQLNNEDKAYLEKRSNNYKESNLSTLLDEDIKFLDEFKKLVEDSIPEIDKINAQLLKVEAMRGKLDAKGNLIATDDEIDRVKNMLNELKGELGDLSTQLDGELKQAIINSSHAFSTDLVNALLEGQSALESFKNFAQNLVAQILSIFLQLKVINPILNEIFGAGTFFTGNTNTGGGSGGGIGLARAGGGTVQKGMPTLVGERGAEIFIPNTSGRIMNNMNSKNAMGGNSIVINQSVNFATGVVPTVRAEVMSMLPQIADVTKASVSEAAARGGQFRRVLQGG